MATWYSVRVDGMVGVNEAVEVHPENGTDFSLKELQYYIGGYIEVVQLKGGRLMIVDEEGKLKGLPFNVAATMAYNEGTGRYDDIILGNALVCEGREVR